MEQILIVAGKALNKCFTFQQANAVICVTDNLEPVEDWICDDDAEGQAIAYVIAALTGGDKVEVPDATLLGLNALVDVINNT